MGPDFLPTAWVPDDPGLLTAHARWSSCEVPLGMASPAWAGEPTGPVNLPAVLGPGPRPRTWPTDSAHGLGPWTWPINRTHEPGP